MSWTRRVTSQFACLMFASGVMNVLTAADAAYRRTHVKTFTIENETNNIIIHASLREAEAVPDAERFESEAALAKSAANWPSARLIEIWNSLPGETPVKKFKDRASAITRIWKAIQNLGQAAPLAEAELPDMTAPIAGLLPAGADGPNSEQTTQSGDAVQPEITSENPDLAPVAAVVQETSDVPREPPPVNSKRARPKTTAPASVTSVSGPREGSKTSAVIAMLKRDGGVTLEEIMTTMGWQKHTTRALLSAGGSLTKKHGLVITSARVGDQRMYSIKS
jgi:hypothetical protein